MTRLRAGPAKIKTAAAAIYRPRQPLESDFHRLVRQHFDTLRDVYGARYARQLGYWRPIIATTVAKFLRCGDPRHGFARARCAECRHEFFVAFSCKQRCLCPSCAQKRASPAVEMDPDFLEHLRREQEAEQLKLPWD